MSSTSLPDLRINKKVLLEGSIKEELNKLFYVEPKYQEELQMLRHQYAHEEKERSGLHASSITGASKNFCYREQVISILHREFKQKNKSVPKMIKSEFERTQREIKIPTHLARIFEEGKSIGTKWQRLFTRAEIGEKEDMDVLRFHKKYDLIYTPDAIITLNDKKYVVEIKSMNHDGFQKAKSHPTGQKQLKLYMYMEGIDDGFVLVDNKNTSDFKILIENDVNESDEHIAEYLHKLEKIQRLKEKTLKTKRLPPCKCPKCK